MKIKSIEVEKEKKKELQRRLSGELLSEVADLVKESLKAEDLENVVMDEEDERQRRMAEGGNPYVPVEAELTIDDHDNAEAALARVNMMEEAERARRVSEVEQEELMESQTSRAVSALEEEVERTMRLCDKDYEQREETKGHTEAALIREMIEIKKDEDHEHAILDSQADLIGTVIDEIEERRRRISTGDASGKIHGHMTASIVKEHVAACRKADIQVESEREADIIGCYVDEAEERERRSSLPIKKHDMDHAHKEATIIANDPLRWELPPATSNTA